MSSGAKEPSGRRVARRAYLLASSSSPALPLTMSWGSSLSPLPTFTAEKNMNKRRVVARVTREIAAKPREVFEAWTDPKHPASPWSKLNGIRMAIVNPAVDGLFYINMGPPMPLATHFGRFLRLNKPKLIEHTWASEGTLGAETLVRITLKAKGDGTLFSLHHT